MKRSFILIVVGILLLSVVSLFPKVKVEIWSWRSQDEPVWEEVQKRLNEMGKDIEIVYRAFLPTEYDSKVMMTLKSGKGPDIIYSRRLPGVRTQSLIEAGLLIPIDGKVDLSNFSEGVLNNIRYKGKTYGVPFAVQVVGIFYNKRIYEKYGLKEPKTWDELVENARILKENGVIPFFVPGKSAWALTMQHAIVGTSILGPCWIKRLMEGHTDFMDPDWIYVNKLLNDLKVYYQDGFMANTTDDLNSAFAFEQAAMVFYGIWGYGNWKELNPEMEGNVGYFMAPPDCECGQPWAYVFMDGALALTSNSKNPDAALEVLKFAATPEFGTIFAEKTYNIPAVKGAKMPEDELLKEILEVASKHASPYVYWVGSVFVSGKPSLYQDVLSPGMQAMYAGEITPEELAKKAQDALSQWFEPLKKRLGK